jgi:hypothetical protein
VSRVLVVSIPYFSSKPGGSCTSIDCAAADARIGYRRQLCSVNIALVEFQTISGPCTGSKQAMVQFEVSPILHPVSHRKTVSLA